METTQITLAAFSLAQDLFMDGFAQEETYQILINALKFAGMVFQLGMKPAMMEITLTTKDVCLTVEERISFITALEEMQLVLLFAKKFVGMAL